MSATPATSTTPQPPEPTPNVDEELVTQLWESEVFWYALPTPAHLADVPEIELVVTGRVQGFEPGPIYFAESLDDPEAEPNVVMSVTVDEVLKGDIQVGSTVYVAREDEKPLAAYSEALPPGTVVGLYLDAAPEEGDREGFVVGNENAGHPAGEPLWQVGPQAFIVADGEDGGVIFPIDPRVSPQADFEDQLPPPDSTAPLN